jgi:hypothetical protein
VLLGDFISHLRNQPLSQNQHHHFLLACMPKSGSTWLATLISQTLHIPMGVLVPGYEGREQELDVNSLLMHHQFSYVAQNHLRYSQPTHQLIQRFQLKPIVLFRNLFDTIVSIADFLPTQGAHANTYLAFIREPQLALTRQELIDLIVEYFVPWYIHFYLSWQHAGVRHITLFYRDILADPAKVMRRIMAFYDVEVSDDQIQQGMIKAATIDTRKNKAVIGRGAQLSEEVKDRIRRYTTFYKDTDFSPIGL